MSIFRAIAWMLGAMAALVLGLQLIVSVRPGAATDIVTIGAWESAVYLLFCGFVLRGQEHETGLLPALGIRSSHPALPVLGLGLGISLQAPADTLQQIVSRFVAPSESELTYRALLFSAETPLQAMLIVLFAVCAIPLVEELFFRGAVFGSLRRSHSGVAAAVVTGIGFLLSHPDYKVWLPLALVSSVLSYLRWVGGSLLACIALHVGFNGVSVSAILSGARPSYRGLELPWEIAVVGWAFCALLIYGVHLAAGQDEARKARSEDAGG